jgi:hypothetical protein
MHAAPDLEARKASKQGKEERGGERAGNSSKPLLSVRECKQEIEESEEDREGGGGGGEEARGRRREEATGSRRSFPHLRTR